MMYLGIDIGKNNHEAGIITEGGKKVGKSLRFSNDREGFTALLDLIGRSVPAGGDLSIGMEATGHYWIPLYSFLHEKGFKVRVINPIQSDSLRNFHIRQAKTDSIDCFLIAETLRFGGFTETRLADEDIMSLQKLARFRESPSRTNAETASARSSPFWTGFSRSTTLFSPTCSAKAPKPSSRPAERPNRLLKWM